MLLAVGMFVGCIEEDMDDCPKYGVNTLSLSYKGDGTTEIFNEKIEQVVMYVFDENEQLVTTRQLTKDELVRRSFTLPELEPAAYRVVCFGNTANTRVNDLKCGDCDQMYCAAKEYFDGETIPGNDPLYYSSLYLTVTGEDTNETMEFASAHYKVSVEVAGVPAGSDLTIELCNVLPYTTFENVAGGEPTTYVLDCDYDKGLQTALSNIMRHQDHSVVNVCVRNAKGEDMAVVNLKDFLAANPVVDCSKNEVLIAIRFEFKSAGVEITVPDWYVEEVKPEY